MNYYIAGVLTLYVAVWLINLPRKTTTKKYLQIMLRDQNRKIINLEFARNQMLKNREGARQELDNLTSKLFTLDETIKTEQKEKKMSSDERARLGDQKVILERDIGRAKDALDEIDMSIHGKKQTKEDPDGKPGVSDIIEKARNDKLDLEDYINGKEYTTKL